MLERFSNVVTHSGETLINKVSGQPFFANIENLLKKTSDESDDSTSNGEIEEIKLEEEENIAESQLPSRFLRIDEPGEIHGSFVWLWNKRFGVEPGFECLEISNNAFVTVFNEILNYAIDYRVDSVTGRFNSVREDLDRRSVKSMTAAFLQLDGKSEDQCTTFFLNKFEVLGYSLVMVKMDYKDGERVTIELEQAEAINAITSKTEWMGPAAKGSNMVAGFFYKEIRKVDYSNASVEAFREFFVTKEIASNILGIRSVQSIELIDRENDLGDGIKVHMYALKIKMNRRFQDFSSAFVDGQRVVDVEEKYGFEAIETKGLGETFALQVVFGNYDALGSCGANGGFDDFGYFLIDLGKAFSKGNSLLLRVNSMLLAEQDSSDAKNFSIFDNTSLSSRVRGVLLLYRACGHVIDESVVRSHGEDFVDLYNSVELISLKFKKYRDFFKYKMQFSPDEVEREHWCLHLNELDTVESAFKENADILFKKAENYLSMRKYEVDIIEGLCKISVKPLFLTTKSINDEVLLNRIRLNTYRNDDLVIWNVERDDEKQRAMFSFNVLSKLERLGVYARLKKFIDMSRVQVSARGIIFDVGYADLEQCSIILSDLNIANIYSLQLSQGELREDRLIENLDDSVLLSEKNEGEGGMFGRDDGLLESEFFDEEYRFVNFVENNPRLQKAIKEETIRQKKARHDNVSCAEKTQSDVLEFKQDNTIVENQAATTLQSRWRRYLDRKKLPEDQAELSLKSIKDDILAKIKDTGFDLGVGGSWHSIDGSYDNEIQGKISVPRRIKKILDIIDGRINLPDQGPMLASQKIAAIEKIKNEAPQYGYGNNVLFFFARTQKSTNAYIATIQTRPLAP